MRRPPPIVFPSGPRRRSTSRQSFTGQRTGASAVWVSTRPTGVFTVRAGERPVLLSGSSSGLLKGGGSTPEKRDSTPLAGPGPPLSPPCPPATPTKGYTWHSPGLSQSPQGTPQEDDHDEVTPSSTEGGDRHASLTVWNPPRELLTGHTTVAGTRGARWERE